MMQPARERVLQWRPLAERIAPEHRLDPNLITCIIGQESAGNPYAVRPEPGFWKRYWTGIQRAVLNNGYGPDDRWLKYPDLGSASYGLMQVLWVVAVERGARLEFPTELCDPERNLGVGCRHLVVLRRQLGATATVTTLLQRYNGGGDPRYHLRVESWREYLKLPPFELWGPNPAPLTAA